MQIRPKRSVWQYPSTRVTLLLIVLVGIPALIGCRSVNSPHDHQTTAKHTSIYDATWRNEASYSVWVDTHGINDCNVDDAPPGSRIFELPREMEAFVDYAYATITSTSGIRSVAAITGRHAYCTVPGESTFEHDFVSMLDLGNSSLDVFPYTMGIDAEVTSGQMIDFVNKLKQDNCNRSLLEYLATFDIDASSEFILKPMPNQRLVGDAVLINGRFRGKLWSEGDRLMAQWVGDETPDADGELFELDILEWRYLDVNRDGFRDVVIFFMVNSYCDWIVLTRKTSTQSRFDEVGTVAVSE